MLAPANEIKALDVLLPNGGNVLHYTERACDTKFTSSFRFITKVATNELTDIWINFGVQ